MTTMSDERGRKSVAELVADLPARVYPIGRLDMDSEGLLLMTNDGVFANRLAHPSFGHRKVYVVTVAGCVPNEAADRLRAMRELDGEPIAPCEVGILERCAQESRLRIVLTEGKNRQIRRMAKAVGLARDGASARRRRRRVARRAAKRPLARADAAAGARARGRDRPSDGRKRRGTGRPRERMRFTH